MREEPSPGHHFLVRLLVTTVGLVVAVSILLALVLQHYVGKEFVEQIAHDNRALAQEMATIFSGLSAMEDEAEAREAIQRVVESASLEHGFVCVTDRDGTLLAHPDRELVEQGLSMADLPFQRFGHTTEEFGQFLDTETALEGRLDTPGGTHIVVTRPFGPEGWRVNIHQNEARVGELQSGLNARLLLCVGGFLLLLLPTMAWLVTRQVRAYESVIASHEAEIRAHNAELEEKVRRQTQELLKSEKLAQIGGLLQGVIHNLRSPLTAINGFNELLRLDYPDDDRVATISDACDRMQEMLENLLESGRKSATEEAGPMNLNELVEGSMRLLQANLFFKSQVEAELDLDPTLPEIEGIYARWSQALMNLLQNAVEALHSAEEKQLRVRTRREEELALVEVEDSGPGVPKEARGRLFEPFFTTKPLNTDDDEPTGTGLGLWSARTLLASEGAKLSFESRPGRTVFRIRLPLRTEDSERPATATPAAS